MTIKRAAKHYRIDEKDMIGFLIMRGYVYKSDGKLTTTILGKKNGYCFDGLFGSIKLTKKGLIKILNIFSY